MPSQKKSEKVYKLWVVVEEYDPSTDTHRDLDDGDGVYPCSIGEFTSLEVALQELEALDPYYNGGSRD